MSDATFFANHLERVMRSITVAPERRFLGIATLLFISSSAGTIFWCVSMSEMGEMPMLGGSTISMAWMPMCGEMWPAGAAPSLGMWVVMMVAMMLPSLVPMLSRYRQAVRRTAKTHLDQLTALVGIGYFFVWTLFGMAAIPLGAALAKLEVEAGLGRAVPIAVGAVLLMAGAIQFTSWKVQHLTCWREALGLGCPLPANPSTALRYGVRLALHCSRCCANLMAILVVVGIMDLRAMAFVTAVITVERLAPAGERVARAVGAIVVGAGLTLVAQAAGLG